MKNGKYLFCDIGNTTIDMILTDFVTFQSFKVITGKTEILNEVIASLKETGRAFLASVNSKATASLVLALNKNHIPFTALDEKMMSAYVEKKHYVIPNIAILGQDLFCDLIAEDTKEGQIILDMGTADKLLYLTQKKEFAGGMIFPGLANSPETLALKTSLLKKQPLIENPPLISLKTEESISSGAINGSAMMFVSCIQRIRKEYHDPDAKVYLTGGNAFYVRNLLAKYGLKTFVYKSNFVLLGLMKAFGFEKAAL